MKKLIALLVVAALISGCTGSFVLTKSVYKLHRDMDNKWADEFVFLACAYLPVYALAMLGDAIIFNTIEFWSDKNPLLASVEGDGTIRVAKKGDMEAVMEYQENGDVKVDTYKSGELQDSFVVAKTESCVTVKDVDGNILYTSTKDGSGGVTIRNADGKKIRHFSAEQIAYMKEKKLNEYTQS